MDVSTDAAASPPTLATALTDTLTDLGVFVDGQALDLSTLEGVRETAATVAEEIDPAAFCSSPGDDADPAGVDSRLAAAAAARGHVAPPAAGVHERALSLLAFFTADLAATRLAAGLPLTSGAAAAATGVPESAGEPSTTSPSAAATGEDAQLAAAIAILSSALPGGLGAPSSPCSHPFPANSTAVADALTAAASVAAATPGLPATRPPILDTVTLGGLTAKQVAAIDDLAARLDAEYAERVATLVRRATTTVAAMRRGHQDGGATAAAPVSLPPLDGGVAARLAPLSLADAAAATDMLLVVERVSARGGAPAGTAVKRRLMGPVPDRGGRVDGADEGKGGSRGGDRGGRGGHRWAKRGGRGRGRGEGGRGGRR
ncbi:hypothetical protein MMPV_008537 [Pyropia vietnamensis]